MMSRCARYACVAAVVLIGLAAIPTAAYAQASLTGLVEDASGGVLPGVTVEAASPALIEQVRSVVTDGTGRYIIQDLRPGLYTVTFTLPGFATILRDGLELTGSFVATVNAEMRVGGLEETITVTGSAPVVDVQSTSRQQVMTKELIATIPFGRSDRDLAILVPSTTSTRVDVGGSATTVSGRSLVHGSRGSSQRILQSGLSIAVPFDGSGSSQQANMAAYQEVTIDTSAVDATQDAGGIRVNLIPREGGNVFSGSYFGSFANESMQGNNFTQELKDRGLATPNAIRNNFDINPAFGGPVVQDKLWFFTAFRWNGASQFPAGAFENANKNNPDVWTYEPVLSSRPFVESWWRDSSSRLTWQINSQHKVGLTYRYQKSCYCPERIDAETAPEAGLNRNFPSQNQPAVDWTFPATNRLLFEAGALYYRSPTLRNVQDDQNPLMILVEDQGLNLEYRGVSGELRESTINKTFWYRGAMSYITGAHTVKVGIAGGQSDYLQNYISLAQPLEYRFRDGVPNRITITAAPTSLHGIQPQTALYAQHRWTVDKLTLTYGLRYDYFSADFPAVTLGPAALAPNRNITLAELNGAIGWHDLSPKSGLAYDVRGDGRTAIKVSLNKYLEGQGGARGIFGVEMSPAARLVRNTRRSWNDRNGDFVPDCDLTNPARNGECGAMANRNFGTSVPGATYDRDATHGLNKRDNNWEFSTGIQHEILPNTSVDVTYFRRWYGNFTVVDDRSLDASDFDEFSVIAPTDPRLPGGGGQVLSGLFDIKPDVFGRPSDFLITRASNFGNQTQTWNGFDITMNTRPRPGMLLQGGLSTGKTTSDSCDIVGKVGLVSPTTSVGRFSLGSYNPSQLYCNVDGKFLTQVKFIGAFTLPYGLQLSGAFRSEAGREISADVDFRNSDVRPSLGRNLAGGARNTRISAVEPLTMFGERLTQLDLRFAKIFRFGGASATGSLDVYNVLNDNAVLTQSSRFSNWLTPTSILAARFVKVAVQFDF